MEKLFCFRLPLIFSLFLKVLPKNFFVKVTFSKKCNLYFFKSLCTDEAVSEESESVAEMLIECMDLREKLRSDPDRFDVR